MARIRGFAGRRAVPQTVRTDVMIRAVQKTSRLRFSRSLTVAHKDDAKTSSRCPRPGQEYSWTLKCFWMHGSLRLIIGQRRPRADVVIRAVRITYPPWIAADSREQGRRISAFLTLFGSPYPDL